MPTSSLLRPLLPLYLAQRGRISNCVERDRALGREDVREIGSNHSLPPPCRLTSTSHWQKDSTQVTVDTSVQGTLWLQSCEHKRGNVGLQGKEKAHRGWISWAFWPAHSCNWGSKCSLAQQGSEDHALSRTHHTSGILHIANRTWLRSRQSKVVPGIMQHDLTQPANRLTPRDFCPLPQDSL